MTPYGSEPKSTGGGRSAASRAHLGATSRAQQDDQDQQYFARLVADRQRLEELDGDPRRKAAARVKLRRKVASGDTSRLAAHERIKRLDIAFNLSADGSREVSNAELDRLIAEATKNDCYWKDRGGRRAGEYKAVPLGGTANAQGHGNDPTRYLAINSLPWQTWALVDAAAAELPTKEFLVHATRRFMPVFEELTGLRSVVWAVHKKPNNIHPQPTMSCISLPCPRPGKPPRNSQGEERVAGMLLGRPDHRGRGRSPLAWALLGKAGCSLAHLRDAGFDLPGLTGDEHINTKLDEWIAYAGKNKNIVLDLEAEKKWADCITATLEVFPAFRDFFAVAWERFREQKKELIEAIAAEIAKLDPSTISSADTLCYDGQQWSAEQLADAVDDVAYRGLSSQSHGLLWSAGGEKRYAIPAFFQSLVARGVSVAMAQDAIWSCERAWSKIEAQTAKEKTHDERVRDR